ncbi:MAG: heparan-alpha-glucosaminide N-acetyltransferase domain-containing protein [Bacteroidota bacterium]|nr:heparan-alpha-glucosaminide N-acetyltransferase domain-containing protein [Bacteroidota bacterium]
MTNPSSPSESSYRFTALDIFRGLTVCFMIIVNTSVNGATTYWALQHADWNGFTPTDLVFPSFLFAVGSSLSFVMKRWKTMKESEVLLKIFKRTALIFLVGYLMYWFPFFRIDNQLRVMFSPISQTRIMGVLQRIALCYGIVALMVYYLGTKKTIGLGVFFLLAYWGLLFIFGVPGSELTKTGNAVLRLDTWLFGVNHLYNGEGFPFDPEGVLSTLPALFNVIGGYAVGRFLQKKGKSYEGLSKLLLAGIGLLIIAYCWNSFFPVNKKLWTSSYAVLTVGLDCTILAVIIYITDFVGMQKGTHFFLVTGRNPLVIYLMSELGVTVMWMVKVGNEKFSSWLYHHVFLLAGDYFGAFLFSVWWMLCCWLLGYFMDKNKLYVRL